MDIFFHHTPVMKCVPNLLMRVMERMDVNQINSNILIILCNSSALIDSTVQVYIPNCAAIHQDAAIYMLRLQSERD
jgi:hypothetical protein